jgi:hypothetical protein
MSTSQTSVEITLTSNSPFHREEALLVFVFIGF